MRKRILFVVTNMGTGGIMRSLQNFLNCYDNSRFEVVVFAMTHQGVFEGELKNCTVLPRYRMLDASLARYEYQHGFAKFESLVTKLLNKATNYRFQSRLFNQVANDLVKKNHYDAVIGFSEGVPTAFVSVMNHPKKIGWIHCDYASYKKLNGDCFELDIYQRLQHVVCVSDFTAQSFLTIYPSLANRTSYIYNILDDAMMQAKSKDLIPEKFEKECFNIVSVGRIDPVKKLSIIPELARKVTDAGCNIKWYIIGPKGTNEEIALLNKNAEKYNTDGIVFPLGEKKNPYPYIACADLLVNTSISEACPYVINEAKILGTPVVCTDFGSAKEFVKYGMDGYYEPIEKMVNRIIELANNRDELQRLRKNLESFCYDNNAILDQIYEILQ